MMDCDELQTPLLDAQMALSKLHLCGLVWEVRTDFGTVCAGRTAALGKSDRISEVSTHPGVDHPGKAYLTYTTDTNISAAVQMCALPCLALPCLARSFAGG